MIHRSLQSEAFEERAGQSGQLDQDLDYVEIGNIGAYGRSMSTQFNGFGETEVAEVQDSPWPSLYVSAGGAEVISIGSMATN